MGGGSRICCWLSGCSVSSEQAKWLISKVMPWFSLRMRGANAAASLAVMPSRFIPVSTCSAAPPRHCCALQKASHSASSTRLPITGRALTSAKIGAVPGARPLST
jgi:hypothetical protein